MKSEFEFWSDANRILRLHFKLHVFSVFLVMFFMGTGGVLSAANTTPVAKSSGYTGTVSTKDIYTGLIASDPDGQTLTYYVTTLPTHGKLGWYSPSGYIPVVVGAKITSAYMYYTPNVGYVGADSYNWKASDGIATSALATNTITVKANTVPVAQNQSITIVEGLNKNLSPSMTDADSGQTYTYTLVQAPSKGVLKYGTSAWAVGTTTTFNYWYYLANPGVTGNDSFVWKVSDGMASSGNATYSIKINANTVPVANSQQVDAIASTALNINLTYLEPDVGQSKMFILVKAPTNGSLKSYSMVLVAGSTFVYPNVLYTPNAGYIGKDSFTWKLSDGISTSGDALFSIDVKANNPPVIEKLVINKTLLKNKLEDLSSYMAWSQVDKGQNTIFKITSGPTKGALKYGPTVLVVGTSYPISYLSRISYEPSNNFIGSDSFKWQLNDGLDDSAIGTVNLKVIDYSQAGAAPTLNAGVVLMDGENPLRRWSYIRNGKYDFSNHAYKRDGTGNGWRPSMAAPELSDWNNDGLMDLLVGQADGRIALYLNKGTKGHPVFDGFTFLAYANGRDLVSYFSGCACPGGGDACATPRVVDWNNDGKKDLIVGAWGDGELYRSSKRFGIAVFINKGTDAAPVFDEKIWSLFNSSLPSTGFSTGGRPTYMPFMADINNDGISDLLSGENNVWMDAPGKYGPSNGSPSGLVNIFLASQKDHSPAEGSIGTVNSHDFIPSSYYYPTNSFFTTSLDTGIASIMTPNILISGANPVGSRKSVVAVDWNGNGKKDLIVGMQDGTVWFSPNVGSPELPAYTNHYRLNAGGSGIIVGDPAKIGQDRAYINNSGDYHGTSNLVTVNEAQLGVGDLDGDGLDDLVVGDVNGYITFYQRYNPKPVAIEKQVVAAPGKSKSIVLTARLDNGRSPSYSVVTQPSHGTLSGTMPNLIYTATSGYTGSDSFTFKAVDGSSSDTSTIYIKVKSHKPVALGQEIALPVSSNNPISIELKATDDGDEVLTYNIVNAPLHGTLSGSGANRIYTPAPGYIGFDSFTFKVNDGYSDSNIATIPLDVMVAGINFQPATVSVPPGYLLDDGAVYNAVKGYGWTNKLSSAISYHVEGDPLIDTAVRERLPQTWSINLPNGSYFVSLSMGSRVKWNDQDRLILQGNLIIDGEPKVWGPTYTMLDNIPATVSNGKLTLTIGGADNTYVTRLNSLEIRKVKRQIGGSTFVAEDATTKGNWKGKYGSDGYWMTGSDRKLPDYISFFDPYIMYTIQTTVRSTTSTDIRALEHVWDLDTRRVIAFWSGAPANSIEYDLKLLDGQTHRVSIYFLDWDNNSPSQLVEVVDGGDSSNILDSRTMSSFTGGKYLSWDLKGHTKIRITGLNGVWPKTSAIFFGLPEGSAEEPRVLSSVAVTPSTASISSGKTQQFTAAAKDQFGANLATQPAVTWSVSGGGSINSNGLFTAGSVAGGPYIITAMTGGKSGTSSVEVTSGSVPVVSVPSGLTSSAVTTTSFTLSWVASANATGYKIFKNGVQLGISTTNNASVTGLSSGTTYSMTVSAYDAAGNNSAISSALSVTTSTPIDTTAPTVPSNLVSSSVTTSSFTLSWTASTDNVAVTSYEIFKGGVSIGTSTTTSFVVTGLSASTTYSMTVRARDAVPNWSAQSSALSVKTSATPDTVAPSVPAGLASSGITSTGFTLSWTASTDNVAVTGYEILKGGVSIGTSATTSFVVTGLSASTTYSMTVRARDAVPNWSAQSSALSVKTLAASDTIVPSVPAGLVSSAITSTGFTLSWTASTDNVAVTGYEIFRGGVSIGISATTSFAVTSLSASTTYAMTVSAHDAAGNNSAVSTALSVKTSTTPVVGGLISHLKFDETSGTSAADAVDSSRPATLTGGPAWVAGKLGGGLFFDEVNDRVTTPDFNYAPTGQFSVAFWFNVPTNSGNLNKYLYSHGDVTTSNSLNVWLVEGAQGTSPALLRTVLLDSNDTYHIEALDVSLAIADGKWHHYALTVDAKGSTVYIDGTARKSSNKGGDTFNPTGDIYIGSRNDIEASRFYGGSLDDVRLYSTAIDAIEIKKISNTLMLHFKLDEVSGSVANDSSTGNNGTLVGNPTWSVGKFDGGLTFDEVNDHVTVPDFDYGVTGQFTVGFWFNVPSNNGSAYKYIYSHGNVSTQNSLNVYLIEGAQGTTPAIMRTAFRDANDTDQLTALDVSAVIADGQWHHYALVVNTNGSTVYLDGTARKSSNLGGGAFDPTGNIYLGSRNDLNTARFFGGSLDDVRVYSNVLSAGEVLALKTGYTANEVSKIAKTKAVDYDSAPISLSLQDRNMNKVNVINLAHNSFNVTAIPGYHISQIKLDGIEIDTTDNLNFDNLELIIESDNVENNYSEGEADVTGEDILRSIASINRLDEALSELTIKYEITRLATVEEGAESFVGEYLWLDGEVSSKTIGCISKGSKEYFSLKFLVVKETVSSEKLTSNSSQRNPEAEVVVADSTTGTEQILTPEAIFEDAPVNGEPIQSSEITTGNNTTMNGAGGGCSYSQNIGIKDQAGNIILFMMAVFAAFIRKIKRKTNSKS